MATLLRVLGLLPIILVLVFLGWPAQTAASSAQTTSLPHPAAGPAASPLELVLVTGVASPTVEAHPEVASTLESVAPRKLRRLLKREVRPGVAREARRIIDSSAHEPFGTEIPFVVDGREYIARIEEHYHPPGGEARPWGKHPGVSVLVAWSTDDR
ncbi:MAG TPA: hypothetical protein VLC09_18830 [Polyangiaceae bacterium]|nr:hypothetical protein [Polyangiaceae bacterium]